LHGAHPLGQGPSGSRRRDALLRCDAWKCKKRKVGCEEGPALTPARSEGHLSDVMLGSGNRVVRCETRRALPAAGARKRLSAVALACTHLPHIEAMSKG